MSGQVLNFIAKKALKSTATKNINAKDPYFDEVQVYGKDGRPTGKTRKQKKAIPAGLSQQDGHTLKKVRRRAYRLDMSLFNLCGIKFGWSSVIGIVPVIGDFIDLVLAWNVVRTCAQIEGGLPPALKSRMYFNIMLDFGLGLVPFLGDVADAVFRANTRNCWILEEYLVKKKEAEAGVQTGHAAGLAGGTQGNAAIATEPARPAAAKTSLSSTLKGVLGGGRARQHDEEMATGVTAGPSGGVQQQQRVS